MIIRKHKIREKKILLKLTESKGQQRKPQSYAMISVFDLIQESIVTVLEY